MTGKSNYEKMLDEEEYFPDQELADLAYECSEGMIFINSRPPRDMERQNFLQEFFGSIGSHVTIKGNFNCDYGKNIFIGNGTIINCNVTILDTNRVEIGDNVFIAPNCVFSTAGHAIDSEQRAKGLEIARPITVGNNVWIGANVSVLPGVTIGSSSIIGAGSVVNKDIPEGVIAAGNPCKVIRKITEEDKKKYPVFNE